LDLSAVFRSRNQGDGRSMPPSAAHMMQCNIAPVNR
jgi:hypothetical protein